MTDEREALEEAFREVFGDTVLMVCEHGARSERDTAFRFTAMLDCGAYLNAAMMLVPEGTGYLAGVREDGPAAVLLTEMPVRWIFADTPALALLQAIREARKNDA